MCFNLVYISKAVKPLQDADIVFLLEKSRQYNKAHGITGMLLYVEGSFIHLDGGLFIQALEGDEVTVRTLFERIQMDSRHHRIITIHESGTYKRNFKDWSMGFNSLNQRTFEKMPGSFPLNESFLMDCRPKYDNTPFLFLKSFYHINNSKTPKNNNLASENEI